MSPSEGWRLKTGERGGRSAATSWRTLLRILLGPDACRGTLFHGVVLCSG
jgi:hypothetical protein